MLQKKVPVRRCLGCGESKPKKELIRIIRTPEEKVELDLTGKKNGRGAYICRSAECLKKLKKNKRLQSAFRVPVPEEIYDSLLKELENAE